jgi:hypothetical protein
VEVTAAIHWAKLVVPGPMPSFAPDLRGSKSNVDPDRVPGSDETLHERTEKIIAAMADATPLG